MKKMNFLPVFKIVFVVLSLCCLATSCNKDDLSFEGDLDIYFYNHPSDLTVRIYSMENLEVPIYEVSPERDGSLNISLNLGNYIIKPYSSSKHYSTLVFQIRQDKTVSIIYDQNGEGFLN